MSTNRRTFVVIGGGIFGASTALQLARRAAGVVLITQSELASGASGRSLSWLNSFGDNTAKYHALRMAGIDRYRHWLASDPSSARYLRFDGAIYVGQQDAVTRKLRLLRSRDYPVALMDPTQAVAVAPGLKRSALPLSGVLYAPDEGWVDLPMLISEIARRFEAAGGRLVRNAGPAEVEVDAGQVTAVRVSDGRRWTTDTVLVATGAEVPSMVARTGTVIRDATPLAVRVRTTRVASQLKVVVNSPRVALRPDPAGHLVLDHDWAAESIERGPDGSFRVPDATLSALLEEASTLLDGEVDLRLETYRAGPKPIPADGLPVFGELPMVHGYYVAFAHSGATLGLVAGEALAHQMFTGDPDPLLRSFQPSRLIT